MERLRSILPLDETIVGARPGPNRSGADLRDETQQRVKQVGAGRSTASSRTTVRSAPSSARPTSVPVRNHAPGVRARDPSGTYKDRVQHAVQPSLRGERPVEVYLQPFVP